MAVGSVNPIAQKITPEHISGLIELAGKDNDNELADRRDTRRIYAVVGIAGLTAIVGFASLLAVKEKNDLLVEVIKPRRIRHRPGQAIINSCWHADAGQVILGPFC